MLSLSLSLSLSLGFVLLIARAIFHMCFICSLPFYCHLPAAAVYTHTYVYPHMCVHMCVLLSTVIGQHSQANVKVTRRVEAKLLIILCLALHIYRHHQKLLGAML